MKNSKKILIFGAQNSGKSDIAQKYILKLSDKKPYYIATYNNSFQDKYMQKKIKAHKKKRKNHFILIQEPIDLSNVIKPNKNYIIECLSMWVFNLMDKKKIKNQLKYLKKVDANIVFVLNDINTGLVDTNKLVRKYIALNSYAAKKVASFSQEVYEVKYGIKKRLV